MTATLPGSSPRLILGSSSPRRVQLLAQIGIVPDVVQGADIDETPHKAEIPDQYCLRVALEKNAALVAQFPDDFILTADTTGAVGRRILGKPADRAEAEAMIRLLSGRSHAIHTAVVVRAPGRAPAHRVCTSKLRIKRLSEPELQEFLDTNDWVDAAGGYKLQQHMSRHVIQINGSPSGIVGLPLYETMQLLDGLGYKK